MKEPSFMSKSELSREYNTLNNELQSLVMLLPDYDRLKKEVDNLKTNIIIFEKDTEDKIRQIYSEKLDAFTKKDKMVRFNMLLGFVLALFLTTLYAFKQC